MQTEQLDVRPAARGLTAAAWALVPGYCVFQAFALLVHFFGETATPQEEAQAASWLVRASLAAVLLPGLGLLLGGRRRWWVALGVGLVAGALTLGWAQDLRPSPPAAPAPYVCQERSGGGTDCPGG